MYATGAEIVGLPIGAGCLHPGSSEKGRSTGPMIGLAHVGPAGFGGSATLGVQFQSDDDLSDRGTDAGGTDVDLADLETVGSR